MLINFFNFRGKHNAALKQTAFYGLGMVIMKGMSLLMLPLVTRYLNTYEYGLLEILTSIAAISSIVAGFGMTDTLLRFTGETTDKASQQRIVAQILGFSLLLSGVLLALGLAWLYSGYAVFVTLSRYHIMLLMLSIVLEGMIAIPLVYLRFREAALSFFMVTTGKALLQVCLTLLFLEQGRGVSGILEAGLLAALLQAILLMYGQLKATGISFSISAMRVYLPYAWPLVLSGLIAFALNGFDRWVIAASLGLDELALFAIAMKLSLATALLLQPFSLWWFPRRFHVLKHDGEQRVAFYSALGSRLSMLIAVVMMFMAPLLIVLLLPEQYHTSTYYVPALVLVMMFKDNAELLNIGCYLQQTSYYPLAINLLGSSVGVMLMLTGVMQGGVWAIIGALLLAQMVRLWLFYWKSQQLKFIPYPWLSLCRQLLLTLLLAGVSVLWWAPWLINKASFL